MDERALYRLSKDRQLVTPELHPPSDYYGHAHLLKRYASLPPHRSLKAAVAHAVRLGELIWDVDLRTDMPLFLCASESHARDYQSKSGGKKKAVPIGPMIRYVPLDDDPQVARGGKVLVAFPAHSTHYYRAFFDSHLFAERIEALGAEFRRVVVCVYWKDVLQGLARTFAERGFECVTAGHIFDIDFLPRLTRILTSASAVYTNEVGSHVLYAALLEKPVWVERADVIYKRSATRDPLEAFDHPNVVRLLALFSEWKGSASAQQRQFVEDLTGMAYVRSPETMHQLLNEAEERYQREVTLAGRLRHSIRSVRYCQQAIRARLNGGLIPV